MNGQYSAPLGESLSQLGVFPPIVWMAISAFAVIFLFAMPFGGMAVYVERKIAADFHNRIGPNRIGPLGLFQIFADLLKMVAKADSVPSAADRFLFHLAPLLLLTGVLAGFAVVPFAHHGIPADLNIGVLYLLAVTALIPAALLLGAWGSENKWSILGGLRAAAQIISYEVPVALCLLLPVFLTGSLRFSDIVVAQERSGWFLWHNPFCALAAVLLFVGGLAESNRIPFDLPEAESELVSGFNSEYSGIRFGLFALAEFCELFLTCAVTTAVFLGGWNLPGISLEKVFYQAHPLLLGLAQAGIFLGKAFALVFVAMWVRWTLPRLRADQLMAFCWKGLTPLALACLLGTAAWMVVSENRSFAQWVGLWN